MYSGRIKKDNISKACGQNMSRNPKRTIDVREREIMWIVGWAQEMVGMVFDEC